MKLFCIHIWEDIDKKYLRTERQGDCKYGYCNYEYYAITQQCIKCGKTRLFEGRILII